MHRPLHIALIASLTLAIASQLGADQIRYDSPRDWRQWELPLGAVDLTTLGVIQPTRIERRTNAVRNLNDFAGGIRNAGSNLARARFAIDGASYTLAANNGPSTAEESAAAINLAPLEPGAGEPVTSGPHCVVLMLM